MTNLAIDYFSEFNFDEMVFNQNGEAVTDSLKIAKYFKKKHKNVLQAIRNLDCSKGFTTANFSAIARKIKAGIHEREEIYYQITKDGFFFLVMGFNGREAAKIKEAYIFAFNTMQAQIQNKISLFEQMNRLEAEIKEKEKLMSLCGKTMRAR